MGDDIEWRVDSQIGNAERLYADHGKLFRVMWVAAGVVVLAAGLAVVVVPGPVTIVVPAGLAMLAAVFGWAQRLLMVSVRTGVQIKDRVEDTDRTTRLLGAATLALLAAAALALVLLW